MTARRRAPTEDPPDVVRVTRLDWDDFADRLWEQRVVHFAAGVMPRFSDEAAFAAALGAAATVARRTYAHGARPPLRVTIERTQQQSLTEAAPRPADRTLAGYQARMAGLLEGRRYALVIAELHSFSFELWRQERRILDELWRRLGLPLSGAITTLFHGTYEHTPVGVHRDRFGTFLFALHGRKRMRFWRDQPWTAPVSSLVDYQPHLGSSFTVELGPGEALYWPSRYFHVGEGLGDAPATSVNIGVPIAEHHTSYFVDELAVGTIDEVDLPEERRARSRLSPVTASPLVKLPPTALAGAGALSATLPPPLRDAIASLRQLAEPRAARHHVRRTWLARVTASGLEPAPPPPPARPLPKAATLALAADAALRWAPSRDAGGPAVLICAGNGHVVELADTAAARALLRRLAAGEAATVDAWLRPFAARRAGRLGGARQRGEPSRLPATRDGVRRLLQQLVSFRVLQRRPSPSRPAARAARKPRR